MSGKLTSIRTRACKRVFEARRTVAMDTHAGKSIRGSSAAPDK